MEPASELLDWFADHRSAPVVWSRRGDRRLPRRPARRQRERSWRFLDALGVLPRAFPELAPALRERRDDPFLLDPTGLHQWETLERLQELVATPDGAEAWKGVRNRDALRLAAFLVDVLRDDDDRVAVVPSCRAAARARCPGRGAGGDPGRRSRAPAHRGARATRSRSRRSTASAAHYGDLDTALGAYLLATAIADDTLDRQAARRALRPRRRRAAGGELGSGRGDRRAASAPGGGAARATAPTPCSAGSPTPRTRTSWPNDRAGWRATPRSFARWKRRGTRPVPRQRRAADPARPAGRARGRRSRQPWTLRPACTRARRSGLDVDHAVVVTWPDGCALESFLLSTPQVPDAEALRAAVRAADTTSFEIAPVPDAQLEFDDAVSPWSTVLRVRTVDAPGVLGSVTRGDRRRRHRGPLGGDRRRRPGGDRHLRAHGCTGQAARRRAGGDRRQHAAGRGARCPPADVGSRRGIGCARRGRQEVVRPPISTRNPYEIDENLTKIW